MSAGAVGIVVMRGALSYYEATRQWAREHWHELSPIKKKVFKIWLKRMKSQEKGATMERNRLFKLEPGDILVNVNDRHDPLSMVKRWAVGPYEHVFLYLGELGLLRAQRRIIRVPMIFESNGRGVTLRSLASRYGEKVAVMRLKAEHYRRRIPRVLIEAIELASSFQSYYDYLGIVRWVLPRIICEKLGLPMPLSWHRDERQICSEAVFEVFYRARLVDILPSWRVPLPGDFVTDSPLLQELWVGELSESALEGQPE